MESLRVRDIQPSDSAWYVPLVDGLMVPSNSAYRLAFDMVESGLYAAIDGPWLKLWNSTFPLKVKDFVALCHGSDGGAMETVAIIMWSLWYFRNLALWKNVVMDDPQILTFATRFRHDWHASHAVHCRVQLPPRLRQNALGLWSPPPAGTFKCNVDSASFAYQQRTSFVVIVWNDQRQFVKAFSGSYPVLLCPRLVEVFSVREALSWLKSEGYSHVILEGDCMEVFTVLCTALPNLSEFGVLLDDCHRLHTHFQFYFLLGSTNS
ncbi:hypothetical protein Godav_014493 [Gossypium davidsonii]|uniref:RNase H type-1 domain-containing protein n=1 Tax=Gossypium davidsonii TaxID=34287 RepID=A0A7J8RKB7_GOSDV|nr:hypothetical protein [Gossypium davidsonii]